MTSPPPHLPAVPTRCNATPGIEVWDWDKVSRDDFIGSVELSFHTLATGPRDHELTLRTSSGKAAATIQFSIGFQQITHGPRRVRACVRVCVRVCVGGVGIPRGVVGSHLGCAVCEMERSRGPRC